MFYLLCWWFQLQAFVHHDHDGHVEPRGWCISVYTSFVASKSMPHLLSVLFDFELRNPQSVGRGWRRWSRRKHCGQCAGRSIVKSKECRVKVCLVGVLPNNFTSLGHRLLKCPKWWPRPKPHLTDSWPRLQPTSKNMPRTSKDSMVIGWEVMLTFPNYMYIHTYIYILYIYIMYT